MLSKRIVIAFFALVLFFIFIVSTNPKDISLAAILIPFVLLGIVLYNLIILFLERFMSRLANTKKAKLFGLIGTGIFINFALLSSIGQLTPQDTILTVLITILGGFYLYKFQIN